MINLTPLSEDNPRFILVGKYNRLKNLNHQGDWSECRSEEEWLVKLHFLRRCFKEERIDKQKFQDQEKALVTGWLSK